MFLCSSYFVVSSNKIFIIEIYYDANVAKTRDYYWNLRVPGTVLQS